mmetsp:Transcript_17468/g.29476  ORF Transcript_17468/g.29476 Transcript_17468/m.29476 type:complete len:114 (-) Transcript_17468:566-907(-)
MSGNAGPGGSTSDLMAELFKTKTWDDFFYRTPCVKSSYLWGIGCGSLMMAHKTRIYRGHFNHALNAGVLTFLTVSSISFLYCAHNVNKKFEMIRQAFALQGKIKEDPNSSKRP